MDPHLAEGSPRGDRSTATRTAGLGLLSGPDRSRPDRDPGANGESVGGMSGLRAKRGACPQPVYATAGRFAPAVAGKHARQTGELTQALTGIGFVCGGKAGRGSPADSGCRPARTRCCAVSAKVPPRLPASRGCSAWMTGPCGAANATAPCSAIWNDTSPWICWVSDQPTGLPTGWRFAGWLVERTRCVAVASLAAGDELVFGDDWGLFSAIRPMNLASTASRTRS